MTFPKKKRNIPVIYKMINHIFLVHKSHCARLVVSFSELQTSSRWTLTPA